MPAGTPCRRRRRPSSSVRHRSLPAPNTFCSTQFGPGGIGIGGCWNSVPGKTTVSEADPLGLSALKLLRGDGHDAQIPTMFPSPLFSLAPLDCESQKKQLAPVPARLFRACSSYDCLIGAKNGLTKIFRKGTMSCATVKAKWCSCRSGEMVYTLRSGRSARKGVRVRVSPSASKKRQLRAFSACSQK